MCRLLWSRSGPSRVQPVEQCVASQPQNLEGGDFDRGAADAFEICTDLRCSVRLMQGHELDHEASLSVAVFFERAGAVLPTAANAESRSLSLLRVSPAHGSRQAGHCAGGVSHVREALRLFASSTSSRGQSVSQATTSQALA